LKASLLSRFFTYYLDNKHRRNASLPHKALTLQTRQNLGWNLFAAILAHYPMRCKNFLCPATLLATIGLPAFIRSCSTDKERKAQAFDNKGGPA
jgi:hypothetical protein